MTNTEHSPRVAALQQRVDDWISQFEEGYFPPLVNLARLTEEVGELARVISHHEGHKKPKKGEAMGSIPEELGDIMFVLLCLSNQLGIDLGDAVEGVLTKIDKRDRTRWTLKEGSQAESEQGP